VAERSQLREALARNTTASDADRRAAIRALAAAVRNGFAWPTPAHHDDADCPFNHIAQHPRYHVVEVLNRMALRDALAVIVTLCHLPAAVRQDLFDRLSPETREAIMSRLHEVHLVNTHQTREFARDLDSRLKGALRKSGSTRVGS
jgi:hypothetical protein